jgi:hypothetical protein
MSRSQQMNHLKHLEFEIRHLETMLLPHDTGHIHTTISVLEDRIEEIQKEIDKDKVEDPNEQ